MMEPGEISEYVRLGTMWLAIGGGSFVAYHTTLIGVTITNALFSERIDSQKRLTEIVEEEADKLGINTTIKSYLYDYTEGNAIKYKDGSYAISVGGFGAKRSIIKHELYHIFRKDLENLPENKWLRKLKYLFIQEPRAILYETFGIKL